MSLFKELTDLDRIQRGLPPIINESKTRHYHNTWHISKGMEDDTLATLMKNVNVNREYEIPYLAGYSEDGKTIYIDKDMPKSFKPSKGKEVQTDKYLVLHETVEKAMIDSYGLDYFCAHQIAYRAEESAVIADKIDWKEYDGFMMKWVKKIDHFERNQKDEKGLFPSDLDLTPYVDEKDREFIKKLKKDD